MNKKFAVLFVVAAALLVVGGVYAQAPGNGGGWWSGEQIQNIDVVTATIQVTAYDMAGTATYVSSKSVGPGAAYTFIPSDFSGMPEGFAGSAVVSSDRPIKGIVNVTNMQAGSYGIAGGKAAAQYQGMDNPDNTLYFPLVKNNRYGSTTVFYIQNTSGSAAGGNAVFKMDNGGVFTYPLPSIAPNKMIFVTPSDAGVPNTDAGRANIGSLTVYGNQKLAGTVMEYRVAETIATVLNGTRGFTAADFAQKAYAPVVKRNRFGRFTGIQVLNVTGSPINVTINYKGTSATCATHTSSDSHAVDPGKSWTFVQFAGSTNFADNCTGAATIEGTGNFVAIVNEQNMPGSPLAGIVYAAMPDTSKTTKLSAPLFKDQRFNNTTGLQIMNVGTAQATNVVATFACKGGATFTAISLPQTIPAGGAKLFFKPSGMTGTFTASNPFSSANVNCAVTVTADQPIVAIANEMSTLTPPHVDDNNYEGFNLTP